MRVPAMDVTCAKTPYARANALWPAWLNNRTGSALNAMSQIRAGQVAGATPAAVPRAPAPRTARREQRRRKRRQLLMRGGALAAAVALPTFAAQGQWQSIASALGIASAQAAVVPMPFETAGESFPGSAFYFLEEAPRLEYSVADLRVAEGKLDTARYAQEFGAGATAKAFQMAGSGLDKARALQCLSMAVYYEAASESLAGQQAVAQVVLNRVAHPAYPDSVCGVVFQGSERKTGCQFTFTCDGSLARHPSRRGWARAQSVALAALAGQVFTPVGLATHYHTHAVNPYWASSLDLIGSIGAHRFYRWKGNAGRAAAFSDAYFGGEPVAAPAPGGAGNDPATAPVRGFAPPPNSAIGASRPADVPVGAAMGASAGATTAAAPAATPARTDTLPAAGTVKPAYERSGRWIRQPNGT